MVNTLMNNQLVFDSATLLEKGCGLRFNLPDGRTGFVVRFEGKPYAYINQCAHLSVELDWNLGDFFSADQQHIICATHGAIYQPNTGLCVGGPCVGKHLITIPVREENEQIIVNLPDLPL